MSMTRSTFITIVGLTAALATAGLSGCSAPAEAQEVSGTAVPERLATERRLPVRVKQVTATTFVEYGEYVGEARGVSEVRLTADAGGRVIAVNATEGDPVRAGTSLAEIDPDRVRMRYETAVLNERLAREAYEREQRFLEQGNSFQLKVDQAHLAWLQARSALLDAEQMRESAFAESPIDGIVVNRYIDENDTLEPGDPTFDVADLRRVTITVGVPESDIAGVRSLDEAVVEFPSLPGRTFRGTPTSFARGRNERTLSYDVDIEVENTDGAILSGQTARVRLALRRHPDAIVVPSSAVVTRNDAHYVYVVRDGVAREIEVTTGASNRTETVVVRGLVAGDRIVTDGLNRLADGATVSVVDTPAEIAGE